MKEFLKDYFHYTRSERNGFLILALLGLLILLLPAIYKKVFPGSGATDFSAYETEIEEFMALYEKQGEAPSDTFELFDFNPNTASAEDFQKLGLSEKIAQRIENYRAKGGHFFKKEDFKKIYGLKESEYKRFENNIVLETEIEKETYENPKKNSTKEQVVELFEFDPNTVSKTDLLSLGLSEKTATIMMNFRAKGGKFRKREDLSKIYGLSEEDFERLFAYIKIEPEVSPLAVENSEPKSIPKADEHAPEVLIKINSATPEEWQKLHGIGPFYAKKICGFRKQLGGFYSIDQITEIARLPDTVFLKIKPFLLLEGPLQKINLNTASQEDLRKHPYLNNREAGAIVKYREQHGAFVKLDDLHNILALKKETVLKISPYLSIN